MTTKIYVIILASSFVLLILNAIINGFLESSAKFNTDAIAPAVKVFTFVLFCAIVFSFIPLVIKLFIFLQHKIGNQDLTLVKFLQNHEQIVVYCAWGVCALGLAISLPSAIKDGLFK